MKKNVEIILNFRKYLLNKIESLNTEQLNFIPEGFNNNIVWNLAHINSVFQALCYKSSGLPINIEEKYFNPFLPGTVPSAFIEENDIDYIKQQFTIMAEKLHMDLEKGLFEKYNKVEKIEKVYNIHVETVDDAINYLIHHEGIHFNAIITLKRTIENTIS